MEKIRRDSELGTLNYLSDIIILEIFKYLEVKELLLAGSVCKSWNRVSYDEHLWKKLFFKNFKLSKNVKLSPGKTSWYQEYKRLVFHIPTVCTQVLRTHTNQVLHVSFSHDGTLFATASKDGFIIVWNSSDPVSVKYKSDMKRFSWKYTKFSQFNKSDTLLLVSGVHFGASNSTSGEIAVFTLQGNFDLQCRIQNKPYDIFGSWYNDKHVISGDLFWQNHLTSTTRLWINKASQEVDSEHIPIMKKLFKFNNLNGSSIRRIMIARRKKDLNTRCVRVTLHVEPPVGGIEESCSSDGSEEDDDDDDEDEECNTFIKNGVIFKEFSKCSERVLIFIFGSKTYTPHLIGFKIIRGFTFPKKLEMGPSIDERRRLLHAMNYLILEKYDTVDRFIDLNGHIVGMALSPDNRYLYVNCRSWPDGCRITNPLDPPPIASEIDIHVIDMETFTIVGSPLRGHKAYTANNDCFFLFLDVSEEYVVSGAEDSHAYLWDRHYKSCVAKYPHNDVVNCIAFNPVDPSMMVSTSDDFMIKVWRSRQSLQSTDITVYNERATLLVL